MSLEIRLRKEIPPSNWDDLVRGSPDGWGFSLWGWQELILNVSAWGLEDHSFGIRENGRLVAVVPLQFSPSTSRMVSSGWGGSGPVLDGELGTKARQRIVKVAMERCFELTKERGAEEFSLTLSPVTRTSLHSCWGVNPFVFHGLEDRSGISQVIDLDQSEGELWSGLAYDARRQIGIARAQGYTVERANWPECVDDYYVLHCETYRRTGAEVHPREYFAGIAGHMSPGGYSVLWRCRSRNGKTHAYHNACWFGEGGYYHTGCSSAEAGEFGVNYLLFWEALLGAKAAGLLWYDCGAIFPNTNDPKQRGLTTFKTKFGGQPHPAFGGYLALPQAVVHHDVLVVKPIWRRMLSLAKRMTMRTRRAASVILKSFQPKIRFIRPYWSWREIAVMLSWRENCRFSSDQIIPVFCKSLDCSESANVMFLSSGRSALEAVLRGLKSRAQGRRKVVLPSYGCLGIVQPVLNAGLDPCFIDINDDLLPSADDVNNHLDQDTLAVLLVHLSGKGKHYEEVRERAKELGVVVVDDYCHNLGGQPALRDVNISVFSFSPGKNASASAGGAVVDNLRLPEIKAVVDSLAVEPSHNAQARFRHFLSLYGPAWWRLFGSRLAARSRALTTRYQLFRISDLDAKLLLMQLAKLEKIILKRQRNAARFRGAVGTGGGMFGFQNSENHIYTKLTAIFATRTIFETFMSFMNMRGVEIEGMYSPLHLRDGITDTCANTLTKTMDVSPRVANIPVRPNLSLWQLRRIEMALTRFSQRLERGQI